jgi:hypothetical protein
LTNLHVRKAGIVFKARSFSVLRPPTDRFY